MCSTVYAFLKQEISNLTGNHLDIGVFDGDGMCLLASNYNKKTIYGIDPFIEDGYTCNQTQVKKGENMLSQKDITENNLKNYNNTCLYITTSEDFLKNLTDKIINDMNITSVFIDGSHWFKDVMIDANIAFQLIGNKKGIITFDDLSIPEVKKAYEEILELYQDKITKIHHISVSSVVDQSALFIN